jgi:geranylgeranyl reductase family protein
MPDAAIAIVGGGPAGALAAERLSRAGRQVLVFEEKPGWEKPCGGGVTSKTLSLYPFLADAAIEHNSVASCEIISPAGRRVSFPFRRKIAVFSRRILNGALLDRARTSGAQIVHDRVVSISGEPGQWNLRTSTGARVSAEFFVIAAGARSPFRGQFTRPFRAGETMITAGYYIPGRSDAMQVRFVKNLEGYLWTFPRSDHFSAGIVGKVNAAGRTTADLRRLLEEFLDQEGLGYRHAQFFAHVIPAPTAETLMDTAVCGPGWALAGDAAGLVDPITGEGIHYALRSGELLAKAIIAGHAEDYQSMLAREILPELAAAACFADGFYHGNFLGQPLLERMVQFVDKSIRFRDIMADLFAGGQSYLKLRSRCYRDMLPVFWQLISY